MFFCALCAAASAAVVVLFGAAAVLKRAGHDAHPPTTAMGTPVAKARIVP